jgi:hypothetical protein
MSMLVELHRCSKTGIYAVPYRNGKKGKPIQLPDGAIVEVPTESQSAEFEYSMTRALALTSGGGPATIHHANLGLIDSYVHLVGLYVLSDGVPAAVYGAEATRIR